MKASIVDLRYHMNDILKALDRNEKVEIFYHGKRKAWLIPEAKKVQVSMKDHPFFGMDKESEGSVEERINELRRSRYHDI